MKNCYEERLCESVYQHFSLFPTSHQSDGFVTILIFKCTECISATRGFPIKIKQNNDYNCTDSH